MPAYFDSGFCVRQPSWHREELLLDDYPTDWQDAREKAGLLWEPEERPAFFTRALLTDEDFDNFDGVGLPIVKDGEQRILVPMADNKIIVRNDTEDPLGVVGDGFQLVTHDKMGEILESLFGAENGNLKFETAGSVRGGAQVWALVYLDEPYTIIGDDTHTYPYVVLLNAHDGSGACKATYTDIRVVCWNTYGAADMQGNQHGRQFVFRHTGSVNDRIDEAKAALAGARDASVEWQELAKELYGMPVSEAQFNHFLADFIPDPIGEVVSERVHENVAKAQKLFKHLYLDSVTTAAHTGTALGLVDASVEYLDHVRGYRNSDTYMGRTLLKPEPLKAKAVELARAVAA